jgi:hypothetical protein
MVYYPGSHRSGKTLLEADYQVSQANLSGMLVGLPEHDRSNIVQTFHIFQHVFALSNLAEIIGGQNANP